MKEYLIGTSGYYYPAWKNIFYPKGLQPKNWLEYYSSVFNTVELNGTFYRQPKLSDLQKYARVTSDNFKFSVKMSRYITHVLKLKDAKQTILDFQNLVNEGLGNKRTYFLFQMPPSFLYNEENLDLVLNTIPNHAHNVIEFRHLSWWNEKTEQSFKNSGLSFCNVDFPGLSSYFMQCSQVFYLRLHGNPVLFKSAYREDQLQDFYRMMPKDLDNYAVYFNNTYYDAGFKNAMQMMELMQNFAK